MVCVTNNGIRDTKPRGAAMLSRKNSKIVAFRFWNLNFNLRHWRYFLADLCRGLIVAAVTILLTLAIFYSLPS